VIRSLHKLASISLSTDHSFPTTSITSNNNMNHIMVNAEKSGVLHQISVTSYISGTVISEDVSASNEELNDIGGGMISSNTAMVTITSIILPTIQDRIRSTFFDGWYAVLDGMRLLALEGSMTLSMNDHSTNYSNNIIKRKGKILDIRNLVKIRFSFFRLSFCFPFH